MPASDVIEKSIKAAKASLPEYSDRLGMVFGYIVSHKIDHDGNSPTIREICAACGISSTSAVDYNLQKLERAKLIRLTIIAHRARGIEVVGGKWLPPKGIE